jgi:N-acetylglucosamine-6-sulfatase
MRYDPLGVQGVVSDAPALNVDLAPTIAEVVGVEAPGAQGSSLVPLLEGQGATWRSDFLVEHLDSGSDLSPPSYCAVRTNRHLYALYETGEEELYDLQEDPFQLENLAADPGAGALRDRLHDRLRELCDSPPPGFPEELLAP